MEDVEEEEEPNKSTWLLSNYINEPEEDQDKKSRNSKDEEQTANHRKPE